MGGEKVGQKQEQIKERGVSPVSSILEIFMKTYIVPGIMMSDG